MEKENHLKPFRVLFRKLGNETAGQHVQINPGITVNRNPSYRIMFSYIWQEVF